MKLNLPEFKLILNKAARIIPTKVTIPALSMGLFDGESLTVTNTKYTLYQKVNGDLIQPILIPIQKLRDFIGTLSGDEVEIEIKKNKLYVECGKINASFPINDDTSEFEETKDIIECKSSVKLNCDKLRLGIQQCNVSATLDEARPVLTGVNFQFDGSKNLTLWSADGFRATKYQMEYEGKIDLINNLLVPIGGLNELKEILAGDEVGLCLDKSQDGILNKVIFIIGNEEKSRLSIQLLAGQYPDIEQFFSNDDELRVKINVSKMIGLLNQSLIFVSSVHGKAVSIKVDESSLGVSYQSEEENYQGEIECEVLKGNGIEQINLNGQYLLDISKVINGLEMELVIGTPGQQVVINDQCSQFVVLAIRN